MDSNTKTGGGRSGGARGDGKGRYGGTRGGNNKHQGYYTPPPTKGLNATLPYLETKAGGALRGDETENFRITFRTYTIANYIDGMHKIWDHDGDYPAFEEPVDPDRGATEAAKEKWKIVYRNYDRNMTRLREEKSKLFGEIRGQIGLGVVDLISKNADGQAALRDNSPKRLIRAIVGSHIMAPEADDNRNYYLAETNYRNQLQMGDGENVHNFLRRFKVQLAALTAAAERAGEAARIPSVAQQVLHFIERLNRNVYSEFKSNFKRNLIQDNLDTLDNALAAIVNHGVDQSTRRNNNNGNGPYGASNYKAGVFVTGRGRGRGRGDRGGRGGRNGRGGRGGRGACAICHEEGHWKNECPQKEKGRDDDDMLISEAVSEAKGSGAKAGGGEQKKKN